MFQTFTLEIEKKGKKKIIGERKIMCEKEGQMIEKMLFLAINDDKESESIVALTFLGIGNKKERNLNGTG